MNLQLSIIIPVYNEEECVLTTYKELQKVLSQYGRSYEILYIDDGSNDNTFALLKELHKKNNEITIIKFRSNFGQSAAMKAGFDHARGEIIVTMDGDMQNDPHDIPKLIEKLQQEDFDVVCGWRKKRYDPRLKRMFSKNANHLRSWMTGETIHDSGCTLRAYTHDSVQNLELYGELHRYIPAMLLWRGYHIGEIVVNHRERIGGRSKYNWQRLAKGFLDLLVISFWQRYSARPMHIFGGTGLLLGFIGAVSLGYLLFLRIFCGSSLMERPLFFISFFLIVISIQFFAFGILADINMKVYHQKNNIGTYLIERVVE